MEEESVSSRNFEREWNERILTALRAKVERGAYDEINGQAGIKLLPSEISDHTEDEARRFLSLVVETGYFDDLWKIYGMWIMRGWYLFFTEPTGR